MRGSTVYIRTYMYKCMYMCIIIIFVVQIYIYVHVYTCRIINKHCAHMNTSLKANCVYV